LVNLRGAGVDYEATHGLPLLASKKKKKKKKTKKKKNKKKKSVKEPL